MQFAALTLLTFLSALALLAGAAPLARRPHPWSSDSNTEAAPVGRRPHPWSSDSNTGNARVGEGTYYEPGLGACGVTNTTADMIAAVAIGRGKGECGKKVRITRGRKFVDLVIQDLCGACKPNDIDMTVEAFKKLGSPDEGRVPIKWTYQDN